MLSVVNYHYIRESFDTKYPSIFGMTNSQFKKQLVLLKGQGDFLNISDFNNNYESILVSKDNFYLITFDDGLKEQFTNGYSILNELDLEGYFFLNAVNFKNKKVTLIHEIHLLRSEIDPKKLLKIIYNKLEFIFSNEEKKRSHKIYRFDDKASAEVKYILNFLISEAKKEFLINELFNTYFNEKEVVENLYMNVNQIIELSKKGMIGNHTFNHKHLGKLNEDELFYEINESKNYLESIINRNINTISYPYGSEEVFTKKVINCSKETDHKFGFTTVKGKNLKDDNLLKLKRFDCNDLQGGKNYEN
ncbi:hypothetical protein BTO04_01810 [Polaribacter sp. SA4-10]|uniref:polysaccharide deacetylase family protein n=1 Tax=Polaribacter sp. SA4-10 TaxID=754397 RepID=UPI000B3CF82B|nr:polysaccharide deacetylase family protein [Polaribacter sp. SA4-10]ARV05506.1 hypothetical protein BTO04_01810 [Polaribacter sp. SA4-10]